MLTPEDVMEKYIFFRLFAYDDYIMIGKIKGLNPLTRDVDDFNFYGPSLRAAYDRHRHQAYG